MYLHGSPVISLNTALQENINLAGFVPVAISGLMAFSQAANLLESPKYVNRTRLYGAIFKKMIPKTNLLFTVIFCCSFFLADGLLHLPRIKPQLTVCKLNGLLWVGGIFANEIKICFQLFCGGVHFGNSDGARNWKIRVCITVSNITRDDTIGITE
jgi:hypothetical protein